VKEPLPVVLERDRSQAEAVLPLETYINRRLTRTLINRGRTVVNTFRPTLERVASEYGVPVRILAGIWGAESNFGAFSGTRPIVAALATLAWDPRRSTFFRGELLSALEIVNRGDIELERLKGSWAGAMGQPQFMPSSYLTYAVDHDGDGRRDIWSSPGDVLASIANYLKGKGWVAGQTWGREVKLSKETAGDIRATVPRRAGSCTAKRDMTVPLPLSEWTRMGVRTVTGGQLPPSEMVASLVSGTTKHYLVYSNYDALLDYNCAHAYALSVAILGERIAGTTAPAPPPRRTAPRRTRP
jgi:membrane-bound lytic murein transglycosylase B